MDTELFNSVLGQLITLGTPSNKKIDYIASLGLTAQHWAALQQITIDDKELYQADDNKYYATIHAGCALFQLDALAATPILITQFYKADVYDDEWIDDYMRLIASIGAEALPLIYPAISHNLEQGHEFAASRLVEVVGDIAKEDSQTHDEITPVATSLLANYQQQPEFFNTMAVALLVQCQSLDSIELIRQAFAANKVDLSYMGDVEDVEIELGLRTKRDTPARNYVFESMTKGLTQDQKDAFLSDMNKVLGTIEQPQSMKSQPSLIKEQLPIKRIEAKIGRNDPCPCGSGKKYKKCCLLS